MHGVNCQHELSPTGMSTQGPILRSCACDPGHCAHRSDARLHKDDKDICFSKTLNSCKVPQIRYASVERLLERLTDLRFLSIDFLNTFLHTYRIFTSAAAVLATLADMYKRPLTSIPARWALRPCARGSGTEGEGCLVLLGADLVWSGS